MSLTSLTSPKGRSGRLRTNCQSKAPWPFGRIARGDRADRLRHWSPVAPDAHGGRSSWPGPSGAGEGRFRRRPSHPAYAGMAPDRRSNGGSQPVPLKSVSASAAMLALSSPDSLSAISGETPSATASAIRALVTRPR